jgi:copper chaperone CopZ
MKKIMLTLICLIFSQLLLAKVTSVQIGINGLTCSMCSRSVEMALKKLDFIEGIKMDLKQTQATITFKSNQPINFKKLAKAVKDAGFSVRLLRVNFDELPSIKNSTFAIGTNNITLVNTNNDKINPSIILLGYDYMDKKQLKVWQTKYNNFSPFTKNDNLYFAGLE